MPGCQLFPQFTLLRLCGFSKDLSLQLRKFFSLVVFLFPYANFCSLSFELLLSRYCTSWIGPFCLYKFLLKLCLLAEILGNFLRFVLYIIHYHFNLGCVYVTISPPLNNFILPIILSFQRTLFFLILPFHNSVLIL